MRLAETTSTWNQYCSHCTEECSSASYTLTTSSIAAPSPYYANLTKAFVESLSIPLPTNWSTNWLSEVQNNYVSLEVVCESTKVEIYTQEASVGAVNVLSSVGGQTGLWLGISFLSIMEFIEMLYRILRHECGSVRKTIGNKLGKNSN